MKTYYALHVKSRYTSFDGWFVTVGKKLYKTEKEAEENIPAYKEQIIHACKETILHALDESTIEIRVINFELDEE